MPHVSIVFGTRPEIIKLAPVAAQLGDKARLIHTGQHYDYVMSGQLLASLGMRSPDVILTGIGGRSRAQQIAAMVEQLAAEFELNPPSCVIVQGDTNSVAAAALAANCAGIPVVHVEAGLRSFDSAMPEEINRRIAAVLAAVHCAPTANNRDLLLREGIDDSQIVVTGNTVVEAVRQMLDLSDMGCPAPARRVLATIHRPENTDNPRNLVAILDNLNRIDAEVVLPLHPRTRAALEGAGISDRIGRICLIEPLDYADFLRAACSSSLLVSDSGGIQEECTVLKRPLIVIRRSTERPESVNAGFAHLMSPYDDIAGVANALLRQEGLLEELSTIQSPYGTGKASETIASIALSIVDGSSAETAAKVAQTACLLPGHS